MQQYYVLLCCVWSFACEYRGFSDGAIKHAPYHTHNISTVTPGLSETGLSENLIYPTLCCESPPLLCVLFTLIYPTPGLSDTFYEKQTWSDKPGPTVLRFHTGASLA